MAKLLSKEPDVITADDTPLSKNDLESMNAFWRACNYLSVGMIYLRDNPLLKEPLKTEHVKHRLLGHWGASPALSFVWVHLNRMIVKSRPRRGFRGRTGPRGARRVGAGVSRRDVLRNLSGQEPGRGRDAEVLQAVLLPGTHRQPRHARNARLDPRRRRAWLQPLACLRHGARQPRSDCRLRRGRRRGGDRAARHGVAFEQVPQSRSRWCGAAHLESQRLQDRQSHGPVAHQPRGARSAVHRLRLHAVFRGRQRPGSHASEDGRDAGASDRRDSCAAESRARVEHSRPSALADDRAALAEGVDRAERDQGSQSRRVLAIASSALLRCAGQSGESEAARGLDAQLQARGAVRRRRPARRRRFGPSRPSALDG